MKKNDDEACPRLNVVMFSNTPILFAFFCLIPLPHYTGSDSGIRYHSNREKTLISAETCEALDGTVARNVAHQPNFSIPTWRRSSSLGKNQRAERSTLLSLILMSAQWLHAKSSTWSSKGLFMIIMIYLSSLNPGWTPPRLITTSKFLAVSFSGKIEARINLGRDRCLHQKII